MPHQAGDSGGYRSSKNQKNKKNLKNYLQKQIHIKNLIRTILPLLWGGGLAVVFCLGANLGIPRALASSLSDNLDLAKKAVGNIAPVISETPRDTEAASLVFAPDGYLNKPLVIETEITKEEKPSVRLSPSRPNSSIKTSSSPKLSKTSPSFGGEGNHFTYGYCTYYVASRRYVPWFGNAITWLAGARKFGYTTGNTPQAGAIIVTSEGGYTGHVGIVEAVNGEQITISEMNYRGFGVISSRTISSSYRAIKGYIY